MSQVAKWRFAVAVVSLAAATALSGCYVGRPEAEPLPTPEVSSPEDSPAPELRVAAATSLKDVLVQAIPQFEQATGSKVVLTVMASGLLQKQVQGDVPTDVVITASAKPISELVKGKRVAPGTAATFAGNELVLIVPKGNPSGVRGPSDLTDRGRIVVGNPETTAHGAVARDWLQAIGLWKRIEPKVVFADNSSQTREFVARGEAEAGVAFRTEAMSGEGVEIVYEVPLAYTDKTLRYVAAPTKAAQDPELAAAFVQFLLSDDFQAELADAGFTAVQ